MFQRGRELSRQPITRIELHSQLQAFSREPFLNLLEEVIGAKPTQTELANWARRSPDRWAHAIEIFSKLSGFTEKREVTHNFLVSVMQMGDAEVRQALYDLEQEEYSLSPEGAQPVLISDSRSEAQKKGTKSPIGSESWRDWYAPPRGVPRARKKGA